MEFQNEISTLYTKYEALYDMKFRSLNELFNEKYSAINGGEWGLIQKIYKIVFGKEIGSCRRNIPHAQKALKLKLGL